MRTRPWLGVCIILVLGHRVDGQLINGSVSGVIHDPSGSIIRAARITILNTSDGEKRETATNVAGVYRFQAVRSGVYRVEFAATGFETARLQDVSVGPAQDVVLDRTMTIRYERLTIDVPDTMIGIARASPTVERTFGGDLVRALPHASGARDVTRLALQTPLVTRAPGSSEMSANGQRARQNNFLIDGTDNNDLTLTGSTIRIIPEAVADLHVTSVNYSAEFGRNTGAQISAVTPSGTNALHGESWHYYRANWMEPLNLLNKRAGILETPRYVQNQVGTRIGGPIRKDRTFFFAVWDVDWRREAPDARNAQPITIPTPAGFAALTAVPLREGQSHESRKVALDTLRLLPDVYREAGPLEAAAPQIINGVPIDMGTTRLPMGNRHDLVLGLIRLDKRVGESTHLSYRALVDKRSQPNSAGNRQFGHRFAAALKSLSQNHSISLATLSDGSWANESRLAYLRSTTDFPENDPTSPTVQISGAFTIGGSSALPQGRTASTYQWQDVVSYSIGRHSYRFGFDLRHNRVVNRTTFDLKGTWIFQNLSEFLNNRASSVRQSVTEPSFKAGQVNQSFFLQDDIKVMRELAVSLALRYELSGVPLGFFGAASPEIAAAGVPLPARQDRNNLAPRVGFAFSPSPTSGWLQRVLGRERTVLRGGFGIAYDQIFYNVLTLTAMNYPRVNTSQTLRPDTTDLYPTLPPKQNVTALFDPAISFLNVPSDVQNPTAHFWTLSVQRQLRENYLFEIGYSGNRSYHLLRLGERNPGVITEEQAKAARAEPPGTVPSISRRRINPAWGSRATIESTAVAEYHALALQFQRRFAAGLLLGSNYTWSSNFSDNDEPLAIGDIVLSSPHAPQDFFDYRNEWSRSVFDRTHRFAIHYLFDIPSFRGSHPVLQHLASYWQVAGLADWQSGQPFTVRTGVDSGGSGFSFGWRPDFNPAGIILKDPDTDNFRTFSTPRDDVFLAPFGGAGKRPLANSMPRGGNLGRNTFRGPGFTSWEVSIAKRIPISERLSFQLRWDVFNVWNHRNFRNPVATMNSSAFGTNTSDPGGRTMLLALKLIF